MERFPNIYATCREYGIDMAVQPIPVVPAAHYQCGGVHTDLHGHTDVPGLLAIGEVACTGLHGANRLATNSLLEGLVFAHEAAQVAAELVQSAKAPAAVPDWDPGKAVDSDEQVVVSHNWDEIRRLMWNYVGIVRTDKRLERARRRLELLREEIRAVLLGHPSHRGPHRAAQHRRRRGPGRPCASRRKESRGLHYTLDYPKTLDKAEETLVRRERPA